LNEKQLSELEVIDEDQFSSLVKNAGKKDDASIPLKLDDESPILS
jgi:3-oxoacyl-[acyl-carrier-protein] synthase III